MQFKQAYVTISIYCLYFMKNKCFRLYKLKFDMYHKASWLARTGFADFGKGVKLINGSPYDKTQQLSRLTSTHW